MSQMVKYIYTFSFSLLFAYACISSRHVVYGGIWEKNTSNYITKYDGIDVLIFIISACFVMALAHLLDKRKAAIGQFLFDAKKELNKKKKWLLLLALFLFICWTPYMLTYAPGTVVGDSLSSLNPEGWKSNHHPVAYTLLVQIFVWIGKIVGSPNVGVMCYTLFQTITISLVFSSVVLKLYEIGLKRWICAIIILIYAIFPAFPSYSIMMLKDPLFSVALLWLGYELYKFNNPYNLAIASLLTIFLRNNGIFIVLVLDVVLLLYKGIKIRTVQVMLAVTVFSMIVTGPVYKMAGITNDSEEKYGVPIQQIAYVAVNEYDSLTETEIDSINNFMPVDKLNEIYTPCLVDTIKWNEDFNKEYLANNQGEFIKLWLSLMPKHFKAYVRAYKLETIGFWHAYMQDWYGYIEHYTVEGYGVHGLDAFEKIFHVSIKKYLDAFVPYVGSGTLFWITVFSMLLCLLFGNKRMCLFFAPALLCWLSVMLACPSAFDNRYVLIFMYMNPIVLVIPFWDKQNKEMN